MKTENILLELYPEIDYALVYRPEAYEKFVAAWHYNEETSKWGQGHYFYSLRDAVNYINEKYNGGNQTEKLLDEAYHHITAAEIDLEELEGRQYYYESIRIAGMEALYEHMQEYLETEAEYEG